MTGIDRLGDEVGASASPMRLGLDPKGFQNPQGLKSPPKKHDKEQMDQVRKSLEDWGKGMPSCHLCGWVPCIRP